MTRRDVDLVGAAVAGGCVAVRSAGPLPARFELELYDDKGERFDVRVADGRVLVADRDHLRYFDDATVGRG